MELKAFHNKQDNKQKILTQLESHYKADEIIKGTYWEEGKGCAVGCTVHSDNHKCYETELGIPEWLARLEDYLFENLPNKKAKEFPLKFIQSIPVGFENWTKIYHKLCVYLLTDIIKTEKDEKVIHAVEDIVTLHAKAAKGEIESNLSAARSAAWSAAWSAARSAAESAARSAAESAAWSAATSAARSAARSAAESAAWSAARSAARSAAESAAVVKISDKLLELLENEK